MRLACKASSMEPANVQTFTTACRCWEWLVIRSDICFIERGLNVLSTNHSTAAVDRSIASPAASICARKTRGPSGVQNASTFGWRWSAVEAVGLYVPGGTASYPSSVLMNAVPAKVAGVPRIVMVAPSPDGKLNPLVLAAAKLAGVDEVYRVGGAQAVAALAYGTQTIRPVAKIVGPGNAYVAAAKRRVFGQVGIDMIAGPSEVLILADGSANPDWIAADLLAQAEHDSAAQSILITSDEGINRIADLAGLAKATSRVLTREAVERLFGRMAAVAEGRPLAGSGLPDQPDFYPRLLILREFLHHQGFDSISVETQR